MQRNFRDPLHLQYAHTSYLCTGWDSNIILTTPYFIPLFISSIILAFSLQCEGVCASLQYQTLTEDKLCLGIHDIDVIKLVLMQMPT